MNTPPVLDRLSDLATVGGPRRRASRSRRWGWLGAGLLVATGAAAFVGRRCSAGTTDTPTTGPIEPVADPR